MSTVSSFSFYSVGIMKRYFITATGTDIGKTLLTAALADQLREKHIEIDIKKPLLSGAGQRPNDADVLAEASGQAAEDIASIQLQAPLSPDMAAAAEGRTLALEKVLAACAPKNTAAELQLIEGVGGVMVPINETQTSLDLIEALHAKVIMVTANYLGSLSHTLTALEALKSRGITPHAVVVMDNPALYNMRYDQLPSLQESCKSIARFTSAEILPITTVSTIGNQPLWKVMSDVTQLVL